MTCYWCMPNLKLNGHEVPLSRLSVAQDRMLTADNKR